MRCREEGQSEVLSFGEMGVGVFMWGGAGGVLMGWCCLS